MKKRSTKQNNHKIKQKKDFKRIEKIIKESFKEVKKNLNSSTGNDPIIRYYF